MTEFELNGNTYRIGKMNAINQFHVSRRIAPIIPPLIPVMLKFGDLRAKAEDGADFKKDLDEAAEILGPFADAFAEMPDDKAEYVMGACLSVVRRQQGKDWHPIWDGNNNICRYDDLDMLTLIRLVVRVIQDSLGPITAGLLTSQHSPATKG